MKIGILLRSNPVDEQFAGADRFMEAATSRGHQLEKLQTSQFVFSATAGKYEVLYDGAPFSGFDVLIYRPNFIEEPSLHEYVVRILTETGHRIVNGEAKTSASKNKLEQHLMFHSAGFPCPDWLVVKGRQQARVAAEKLGFPLIVKLAFGARGVGVFYVDSYETLQPIVDYLDIRDGNPMLFEKFIGEANRKDVRAFVVGGRIIAAMERAAPSNEVRANAAVGGVGTETELSTEEEKLVLDVAKLFQLEIGGIDFLRTASGPILLEVNANPGFKELEHATGKDIAGMIIDYAVKMA